MKGKKKLEQSQTKLDVSPHSGLYLLSYTRHKIFCWCFSCTGSRLDPKDKDRNIQHQGLWEQDQELIRMTTDLDIILLCM